MLNYQRSFWCGDLVTPIGGPADSSLTAVRGQSHLLPTSPVPSHLQSQAVPFLTKKPSSQPNLKHPLNLTCQSSPHLNHLNLYKHTSSPTTNHSPTIHQISKTGHDWAAGTQWLTALLRGALCPRLRPGLVEVGLGTAGESQGTILLTRISWAMDQQLWIVSNRYVLNHKPNFGVFFFFKKLDFPGYSRYCKWLHEHIMIVIVL